MSSAPTALLGRSTASSAARVESLGLYRAALWVLLAANLLVGWGVQWDIQWHVQIGRDSFWIPPHLMTYAGVTIAVLISFGVLACDTLRHLASGRLPAGTARIFRLTGTPGFHLAAWGIALTVLAAPIDDLWHRLFGLDVTLWSPPHLLGLFGVAINTLACLLIAREAYPAPPSGRLAYLYGGSWFYTYPILGALLLPLALVTAARVTGRRFAPLVVLILVIAAGMVGAGIARVGFAILQPESVIQEEAAKDPTSPIAVSDEIARKNRSTPGGPVGGNFGRLLAFAPVVLLVALDPRRRPVSATLVYAVGLFAVWGVTIGRTPAFQPMVPAPGPTAAALLITLAMALVGGVAARWLANSLTRAARSPAEGNAR